MLEHFAISFFLRVCVKIQEPILYERNSSLCQCCSMSRSWIRAIRHLSALRT